MNNETFKNVIEKLGNTFDSHQLIEKFMVLNEKEYVELLCSHIGCISMLIFRRPMLFVGQRK
jgi:hypothetical protein